MKLKFPSLIVLSTVIILTSCSTQKKAASPEELAQLEALINSKSYELNARWANPLATQSINAVASAGLLQPGSSPNRIDIIGTASYIRVKNDSVSAILPYYGERQFGGAYNQKEVGIQFNGLAEDFVMEFNDKKQQYEFEFDIINEHGEAFNINGILYPNKNTRFFINSNERLTIGYSGIVSPLDE